MSNGFRKQKKLTRKQAEALEYENMMLKMDIHHRTKNLLVQQDIAYKVVDAMLNDAATIREARIWWEKWKKDVNAIPLDTPNHNSEMQNLLDKYNLEISAELVVDLAEHTLNKLWTKEVDR